MICLGSYRIGIEHSRERPVASGRRHFLTARVAVVTGIALAAVTVGAPAAFASESGGTSLTINAVPTAISVTVSPGSATFTNCTGGTAPTASTTTALGFPNGECLVGTPAGTSNGGIVPISVTNTGIAADIDVNGTGASNEAGGWGLCNATGAAAAQVCVGQSSEPGTNQLVLENFSESPGADFETFLGSTPGDRDALPTFGLTPSELVVARLVTTGLSNREIAAELFVSVKAVEFHLGHIFDKLGIRSRRQVARVLGEPTRQRSLA